MADDALIATVVAGSVAVLGYVVTQQMGRRDRKAKFYAEALLAVKDFEELPYRIAKRPDTSPATRERLGTMVNDAFVKVSFYQAWLRIDSPRVGASYDLLAR